jgi:fatty-acyl-CoA synthase
MLQALLMGDRLIVMTRFHPREALKLVDSERVTILIAIPTAFQAILSIEDFEKYDTSALLICGTGSIPCPPNLARQIQERLSCAVHIGFGSTETAGGIAISSLTDSDEQQATTVGCPLPGMEICIVDDQRCQLPPGQIGELACRSDSVMMGYYQAPDTTSDVIDADGWYYTGDLAVMDEKGYIRIMGRKKDMIIRGGQNIYPAEIETYLSTHPKIREATVVGVPSTVGGEQVWAFILLTDGEQMGVQEVLDFFRAELEPYKIPNKVRFVTDLPRSESGKPQKYILLEKISSEMGGKTQP